MSTWRTARPVVPSPVPWLTLVSVQATSPSRRATHVRRGPRPTARGLVVAGLALAALVTAVGLAYSGSPEHLAGGTRIAGVDVGGLTSATALTVLRGRAAEVERVPVSFTAGGVSRSLSPSQLGVRVDWDAAIKAAQAESSGFGPLRGLRRLRARWLGVDVTPAASAYESVVSFVVGELAGRVDRPAREPSLRRVGLGVTVVDGLRGRRLDQRTARELVVQSVASLERGAPVELPVRGEAPTLVAADLDRAAEQARVALSAPLVLTAGETRWRVARWEIARFLRLPAGGETDLAIAGSGANRWLAELRTLVNRPPRDATFRVRPGGIDVVPGADGRALDIATTAAALLRAVSSPSPRVVALPLEVAAPERSTAEARAMGITGVVGSYTTSYGGTPGRLANVELVAELIDGALVEPGGTFSFNGTTGERNAAKGFREAPVIINGELQNGIGGGVCQVSTTVFNAAFEAGLPIGTRTNHALYISHYPLGRDATVNYPDTDLTFANDSGRWILLRAFVGAGSLTVNLYGTPLRRRVETETEPLTPTGKIPVERRRDPTLLRGKRVIEEIGTPPRETRVVRRVYAGSGELLHETTWASYYRGSPTQVRVGTKPAPKAKGGKPPTAGPAEAAVVVNSGPEVPVRP